MITVVPDGSWTLCIGSQSRKPPTSCQVLSGCPSRLLSVDDVSKVIDSLSTNCKFCIGNPDGKFSVLVDHHGGIFKDRSGKDILLSIYPVMNTCLLTLKVLVLSLAMTIVTIHVQLFVMSAAKFSFRLTILTDAFSVLAKTLEI